MVSVIAAQMEQDIIKRTKNLNNKDYLSGNKIGKKLVTDLNEVMLEINNKPKTKLIKSFFA